MKKTFVAALAAAFAVCTTLPVIAAPTYGTPSYPNAQKRQPLSHEDCVRMRMGTSKSSTAMKRAETWCTAHHDMNTKRKSAAASAY
jgi:hypothetical protein